MRLAAISFLLLTPAAVAQTLEAHYKLDETSGPACDDSTGNLHDGTWVGGMFAQGGAKPGTGTAVRLNGISERADIPDGAGFTDLRSDLTAVCWMNADDFNGVQRFFGNDGSWTWGLVNGSIRFTTRTILDYDHPATLTAGTWHHIACVFDASFDVHFYVDGVFEGTILGNAQANPPFPNWHIGYKDPSIPEYFDGALDDIQIYRGSLTAADVQWLYDNPGQTLGNGQVGINYCGPANPHSGAASARMMAMGNVSLGANSLTLHAMDLPQNQFGYFVFGETTGFFTPPGSQGNLCLGGKLGRFNGQIGNSGATGEFSASVNLTSLPVWGGYAVQPGETWRFQAWFEDGATSNFSDAVEITFQ